MEIDYIRDFDYIEERQSFGVKTDLMEIEDIGTINLYR